MGDGLRHCKFLSADALIKLGWHRDSSIPTKGEKEYAPDGSWIEAKRLEVLFGERRDLLCEERVAKLGSLSRCEWKPHRGLCELLKISGKFWHTVGFSEHGKHYLHPEEALFLLDTGVLEIYHEGLPMTLEQAYNTFIGAHVSLEQYQTYSFLARYGFILRRHDPDLIVTEYERQLRIDQYSRISDKKRKFNSTAEGLREPLKQPDEAIPASPAKILKTQEPAYSTEIPCSPRVEASVGNGDYSPKENTEITNGRYTNWNWQKIDIPNIAGKSSIVVDKPNPDLLPCCVSYDRDSYTLDLSRYKRRQKWDGEYELSLGGTSWKKNIKAANWGEYRIKYQTYLKEYRNETGPAGHLWRGKVKPLVEPQDAKSAVNILQKLQVIECVQLTHPSSRLTYPTPKTEPDLKVLYDVYLPNAKFKKSMHSPPNHHLCITRSSKPFPSLAEMIELSRKCQPKTPLHFAVIDCGDISFYVFHDVSLPVDKSCS